MGVFSCRLYINKFLLTLFVFVINSCTSEIITDIDSQILEIKNTDIEYDSSGLLMARVEFAEESPLDELLSVEVEFQISEQDIFKEDLHDDGTNGDHEANNGNYRLEREISLNNSIYNVSFFAYTEVDTLIISDELVVGSFAPSIKEVCIPTSIEIDENNEQSTIIALSVTENNGLSDIESVKFKIRYVDGYCHHNNCNCDSQDQCLHSITDDESDEYQEDDSYILVHTISEEEIISVLENPAYTFQFGYECLDLFEQYNSDYIFSIIIPFSPYSCGGWGNIGFVFEAIDKSGLKFETEEYLLELFYPSGDCE